MPSAVPKVTSTTVVVVASLWWLRRRWLRRRVVVVCAVEEEARHVVSALRYRRARGHLVRGSLGGVLVDVVTCGVGSVDAAITLTTAMLQGPKPRAVLSVGCSGGHSKYIYPGDVIVSTAIVPTACKMVRSDGSSEHVGLRLNTSDPPVREIETDAGLMEAALSAASALALPVWPTTPERRPTVYRGKVGSSDIWTQSETEINRQHQQLGTLCEEMEAFGVARVCAHFDVPFLAVKDIVNNELDPPADAAAETGLAESLIVPELGRRAAQVAVALLREMHIM